jgi:cytochrome c oxidase assembly factor CtaG
LALAGAAAVLALAAAPPLGTLARRYVVAQALQFALVALALPALLTLGAPLGRLTGAGVLATRVSSRVSARSRHRGPRAVAPSLLPYFVAVLIWRLPVVVDALHASPALFVAEVATFAVLGPLLWGELVPSSPFSPRLAPGARVAVAALAMWEIWLLAYFMGFTRGAWFPAFRHPHGAISVIAEQQLATGALWAVAAAAFLPVIFTSLMRFLSDEEDVDDELRRLVHRSRRSSTAS